MTHRLNCLHTFNAIQYNIYVTNITDSIPKPEDCPFKVDEERKLMTPFSLKQWLAENETKLCEQGAADLFDFMLPGGTEVGLSLSSMWLLYCNMRHVLQYKSCITV